MKTLPDTLPSKTTTPADHLFSSWLTLPARTSLALAALLPLLLVQALAHLFFVALVVELEQAGQHLAASGLADGETHRLRRLVESLN